MTLKTPTFVARYGTGEWAHVPLCEALLEFHRHWCAVHGLPAPRYGGATAPPPEAFGALTRDDDEALARACALGVSMGGPRDLPAAQAALLRALHASPRTWHQSYRRVFDAGVGRLARNVPGPTFRCWDGVTAVRVDNRGGEGGPLPRYDGCATRAFNDVVAFGPLVAKRVDGTLYEILPHDLDALFDTTTGGARVPGLLLLSDAEIAAVADTYRALGAETARKVLGALIFEHPGIGRVLRAQVEAVPARATALTDLL